MALFNGGMGPPDAAGYSASRLGVWRRQFDQFTVFSLPAAGALRPSRRRSASSKPRGPRKSACGWAICRRPRSRRWPIGWAYYRSRETALGNLRLIHAMREQLHVPGEDCKAAAELLIDARLICPLGGQYVYRQTPDGVGYWTTTVWKRCRKPGALPPGFHAPPLDWFRGLTGDGILSADKISLHAEIDMQARENK